MDEFLKMDVFFFVTTIAVIILAFFSAYILWRFERILKNVEHISEQVAKESDNVREDLDELRSDLKRGKNRLVSLLSFFLSSRRGKSKKH